MVMKQKVSIEDVEKALRDGANILPDGDVFTRPFKVSHFKGFVDLMTAEQLDKKFKEY